MLVVVGQVAPVVVKQVDPVEHLVQVVGQLNHQVALLDQVEAVREVLEDDLQLDQEVPLEVVVALVVVIVGHFVVVVLFFLVQEGPPIKEVVPENKFNVLHIFVQKGKIVGRKILQVLVFCDRC